MTMTDIVKTIRNWSNDTFAKKGEAGGSSAVDTEMDGLTEDDILGILNGTDEFDEPSVGE